MCLFGASQSHQLVLSYVGVGGVLVSDYAVPVSKASVITTQFQASRHCLAAQGAAWSCVHNSRDPDLGRGLSNLLDAVLQAQLVGAQLLALAGQQVLVQRDQLQVALGRGVVVPPGRLQVPASGEILVDACIWELWCLWCSAVRAGTEAIKGYSVHLRV